MKNILLLQDNIHCIDSNLFGSEGVNIVSQTCNKFLSDFFLLTHNGHLLCFKMSGESVTFQSSWILDVGDNQWFEVTYVADISSVVCISHSGNISYIQEDLLTKYYSRDVKQNSFIEGGISTAKWNSDQSMLVMITESSMLVLMSNTFAVMAQVPLVERVPASPTCISWRSDGLFFAVLSKDVFETNTRVRLYNRKLDIVGLCRNAGEGEASVMRGLGLVTAYAGNGSYVAVSKHRIKGKQQVVLLDSTEQRREDFDIQLPAVPAGFVEWEVIHLEWDVPCLLLAVGLRCNRAPSTTASDGTNGAGATSAAPHVPTPCVLQLYYRNTYYWYLKQQWEGDRLAFLGFDGESVNRLFMSQLISSGDKVAIPALRIVEIGWDLNSCINVSSGVNLTPAMGGANKGLVRRAAKETVSGGGYAAAAGVAAGSGSATAGSGAIASAAVAAGAGGGSGSNGYLIKSEEGVGVSSSSSSPGSSQNGLGNGHGSNGDMAGVSGLGGGGAAGGEGDKGALSNVMISEMENRKLTEEERIRRCRERNKIDARNTRNRKRVQLEEMQLKVSELLEEKTRLQTMKPVAPLAPHDKDIASILMSLSSNSATDAENSAAAALLGGAGGFDASDANEASILSQFKSSVVRESDFSSSSFGGKNGRGGGGLGGVGGLDDDDDDMDEDDEESTNGDDLGETGGGGGSGSNKRVKVEYSTTDPEARRKERNRIHAQKARLRKKTLLRDMKLLIANLENEIDYLKSGTFGGSLGSSLLQS